MTIAPGGLAAPAAPPPAEARYRSELRASLLIGQRGTFAASLVFFTLAQALFLVLALRAIVPRPLAALVALYPLQLYWSLKTLGQGLTYSSVTRLQTRYRVFYAVVGLAMVAALYG